ncbi:hypothetical protein D092_22400 [Rhodococcus ruber Chol-4]|uniref:Uncharacterized protein n=1 Tax=Rhodococcus ruber TaxID=1830 RepID=A0A098BMQ1_9NOCA|nr:MULTISPECIES: hypothetical protein [Rhodococcus]MDO2379000.1 hypothetical protein [Rhodococcus ruber]ATQ31976.1 hypothetical protein CS378_16350 [Rhodococcus ruber]AUM20015.1 hypothetical protein CSW53_23150 [Rhodococcus ruber]AWH01518.1 hypothetical protein DCN13_00280 [Rhodococcus ruber]AXY49517.1 hypothetical protein YT1_0060 [Rhodococcus ruber]
MTTLSIDHGVLTLRFTRFEKIAGLIRDVDVPLDAIRDVEVHADGLAATRGMRAPGLGLPGARKIGTWRARGRNELVAVRRGQPALRVELSGHARDALVIGMDDAEQWAERLRTRTARA